MPPTPNLLLVDDDRHLADSMAEWLREQGMTVDVATTLESGRAKLGSGSYELLITDLRLEDGDGFDLIGWVKRNRPNVGVLVVTGYATPETAVEAVRAGAFDLLTKPLIDEELSLAISRALAHRSIEAENAKLKQQLDHRFGLENILGHDYRMLKIFDMIESVADARASVLITGENGTGKSMIARAIHRRSNRADGPFVEVACGALPETLLESELFGHVSGAFTGASANKIGKFKLADRGTLFLDEIGTASPAMQVKLLRVLQELQFEQVGGTVTESVDTRVILATNEDLAVAVREGRFRQDLFYRINVVNIELPPLRERVGDIPELIQFFLKKAADNAGREIVGFDRAALDLMQQYPWPGNVRELENVVERSVLLARDALMTIEDLPPQFRGGKSMVVGPNQDLGSRGPGHRGGNSQGFRETDSGQTWSSPSGQGGFSSAKHSSWQEADESQNHGQLLRNHGRHPGGMVFGGHGLPAENLHHSGPNHSGPGVARSSNRPATAPGAASGQSTTWSAAHSWSASQGNEGHQDFGFHGQSLREALEGPERQIILEALRQHDWNRAATADTLQINRTTLYKKMKRLGLDDPRLQFAYS
jgi:DNA-binding NtrC family response regulator